MVDIYVKQGRLSINDLKYKCAFGKAGFAYRKIEGDSSTPIGSFAIRRIFYRADKITLPAMKLDTIIIDKNMGWSDDVNDASYNTLIEFPYEFRAEKMMRDDDIYDVIVELGYNYDPVKISNGSAVFFHIARGEYTGTEGCIAVKLNDMFEILPLLTADSVMHISK